MCALQTSVESRSGGMGGSTAGFWFRFPSLSWLRSRGCVRAGMAGPMLDFSWVESPKDGAMRNAVHPEWDILDILPPGRDIFDPMPLSTPDQGMGETTEIVHVVALPRPVVSTRLSRLSCRICRLMIGKKIGFVSSHCQIQLNSLNPVSGIGHSTGDMPILLSSGGERAILR